MGRRIATNYPPGMFYPSYRYRVCFEAIPMFLLNKKITEEMRGDEAK